PLKATRPAGDAPADDVSRGDASTQALLGREQALWAAWKDRDPERLDAILAADIQFIDIFGNHIATRADTLKAWSGEGCDVKSFQLAGAKATMFAPDLGVLTLRATADAPSASGRTCGRSGDRPSTSSGAIPGCGASGSMSSRRRARTRPSRRAS